MEYSTKRACEIAGISASRLNELIHHQHIRCLPETTPGVARRFNANDIYCLMVYSDLIGFGYTSQVAGEIACEFRDAIGTDGLVNEPILNIVGVQPANSAYGRTYMVWIDNISVDHIQRIANKISSVTNEANPISYAFNVNAYRNRLLAFERCVS